ncbi:MAG: hypothetical protein GY791_01500 [Alphaproteobacteria bacterium]|nr:hypothetical protein [Alphaproteobacteria bacterium]
MAVVIDREADTNRSYQEKLAASLVACMGIDGAVQACLENAWHGVLDYVLSFDAGATRKP